MRKFIFGVATAVAASVIAGAGSVAWAQTAPAIQRPCAIQVKWILSPDGSDRALAESMGYETVAHDDLSYPGPRTGC